MQTFDAIVIGQGYAGLVTAKLLAEAGLKTANAEGLYAGGLVMNINHLDPAPEGTDPVGAEVISAVAMANMDAGITQIMAPVTAMRRDAGGWLLETGEGQLSAPDVVVASGARLRKLGVPGEEAFFGRGVSECADCDGPMFAGMDTVVVGGGDSAFQKITTRSVCGSWTIDGLVNGVAEIGFSERLLFGGEIDAHKDSVG